MKRLEVLNCVKALVDPVDIEQGLHDPSSEEPLAELGPGPVDSLEEGTLVSNWGLEDLQMLQGL